MNQKKIVMLIIVMLIIGILGIVLFLVNRDDDVLIDNSIDGVEVIDTAEMLQDQMVENLKISNVSFVVIDGVTNFFALVTNEGTETIRIDNLYVNFIGNDFEKKIIGLTDTLIKNGGSAEIRIVIDSNLSATKSIKYLLETSNE